MLNGILAMGVMCGAAMIGMSLSTAITQVAYWMIFKPEPPPHQFESKPVKPGRWR